MELSQKIEKFKLLRHPVLDTGSPLCVKPISEIPDQVRDDAAFFE